MIEVADLWAGYGGEPVLRGVDLAVPAGDFVGVLGPNACGKSTLVRVLSGTLKPQQGSARVAGLDVAHSPPRALAQRVATVPQSTTIPFPFTGFELVLMGRFPHMGRFSQERPEDLTAVEEALAQTDTVDLSARLVTEVSGGERQRLVLARALAQQADLLLLDEATAAMDVHRKIDAFDLLVGLNAAGRTVVAVMHDLNLAALFCRRLVFMKEGRIWRDGATAQVFRKEVIEAVYETPVEIFTHPRTGRPHAVFLPRARGEEET